MTSSRWTRTPTATPLTMGDTPGLGLPFCTLRTLTFSGNVTLELAFASDTATYAASADHNVTSTTVTATLYNFS